MPNLAALTHRQLMATRICDLGLRIEESGLERYIHQLYAELDRHPIAYHPPCYLTDEWGCPDEVPVIGIPFYLADPVLIALERELMLDVEGDDPAEMMKLLRHESGHAINYAYKLHERREWARVFGPFNAPYPEHFKSRRFSKRYVRHLEGRYAQRHPDEDFAETFAVWLSPVGNWRSRYAGWGALEKLEFVDHAVHSISGRAPTNGRHELDNPVEKLELTLARYYEQKRAANKATFPEVYDDRLRRIFSRKRAAGAINAAAYLRLKRRELVQRVSHWTGERRYVITQLLAHLTARCRQLRLWLPKARIAEVSADFVAFLTALVMNYRYRGTFLEAL
ncbi:MAG: hypothetical protein HYY16_18280 [Planctomycetes bacterium]|nr:hypothetical protein [Planctomycetota bacterium]